MYKTFLTRSALCNDTALLSLVSYFSILQIVYIVFPQNNDILWEKSPHKTSFHNQIYSAVHALTWLTIHSCFNILCVFLAFETSP